MAAGMSLRHPALPFAVATAGIILYPRRAVYAESPASELQTYRRKPIYETAKHVDPKPEDVHATTVSSDPPSPPKSTSPTPTDRLAGQVKTTRLFLHRYAVKTEDGLNNLMTRFLKLESSFTQTVASLAPPKESGEKLLPGGIYVLVAAMAGSIITRNRNILLRATVPLATGIGTAQYVVPVTTRNVGNLIWSYEEKYPVVRDNHLRISEGIRHFIDTGKAHSQMGMAMAEEKVQGVRDSLDDWVKKGK